MKYYPPKYGEFQFHCALCVVFAKQEWKDLSYMHVHQYLSTIIRISICSHCGKFSYWNKESETMVIPNSSNAPLPHPDLPESIADDYLEARSIANQSPRGAAALLRLCLQKLMVELGETGKDINKDIGLLVEKGLPEEVQQALDIVRVIGNESVHPGELDLQDDQDTVLQLFDLINFIVEERISRKKKISSLFSRLPVGKRDGIEQRDNK